MKFTRRPDLDPDTRIEIVKLAWLHQGVYGKMTQIDSLITSLGPFSINCWLPPTSSCTSSLAMNSAGCQTLNHMSNNSSCCYAWKGDARFRVYRQF